MLSAVIVSSCRVRPRFSPHSGLVVRDILGYLYRYRASSLTCAPRATSSANGRIRLAACRQPELQIRSSHVTGTRISGKAATIASKSEPTTMSKLYVGNLPSDCNESALRQLFQDHNLSCTTILVKRGGYAFVDCTDQSVADRAIDKLNGKFRTTVRTLV